MTPSTEVPGHENPAYVEKSRALMAERDTQIFGKGHAFAMRTDQGWLPPSAKDTDAVLAEPTKETEA